MNCTERRQNDPQNSHRCFFDRGQYHSFFKDGDTCEEVSMDLRARTDRSQLQVSMAMQFRAHDPEFMTAGS